VATNQEDHAYDEVRYACMSRPWRGKAGRPATPPRDRWGRAFDSRQPHGWRVA